MKAAEAERAAARRDNDRMQAFIASLVPLSTEALYAMSLECVEQAEKLWDAWSHDERCCRVEEHRLIHVQALKRWRAGEFGPIDPYPLGKVFEFGDPPSGGTKLGQAIQEPKVYALRNTLKLAADLLAMRAGREPGRYGPSITPEWSPDDEGGENAD